MFTNQNRKVIALGAVVLAGASACAVPDVTSVRSQGINLFGAKWPGGQVSVCWDAASAARPNFASEAATVRSRALATWSTAAKVDFVGWATCPGATAGFAVLRLHDDALEASACLGYPGASFSCTIDLGVQRSDFATSLVPHELGHALGFTDEPSRPDFPDDPTGTCRENDENGQTLDTPPDRQSIMASIGICNNNANLDFWDIWGVQNAYGPRIAGMTQLATAWSAGRGDYDTVATAAGRSDVDGTGGYRWLYSEGWVFAHQAPGTVPLELYWNVARGDNFSTATTDGINSAISAGYVHVRTEGYVYPSQQPGTVPLKLYWSNANQDNLTTANADAQAAALSAGYVEIRTEGYVFADLPYAVGVMLANPTLGDNVVPASTGSLVKQLLGTGWKVLGIDAAYLRNSVPGTAVAFTYWSGARGDYETAALTGTRQVAQAGGYSPVMGEGYWFTSSYNSTDLDAMTLYWSNIWQDNFTTFAGAPAAKAAGYTGVDIEGYGLATR